MVSREVGVSYVAGLINRLGNKMSAKPTRDRRESILRDAFLNEYSPIFQWVHRILVVAILYSVSIVMLETVPDFTHRHETFFRVSEYSVLAIFLFEYIARIHVTKPSMAYVFSVWGLIDLLAVLPSAMSLAHLTGLPLARVGRLLRVVRFLRVLRILKLAKVMAEDYEESKSQRFGTLRIDLQIYFMATFSVLVISSTLMYFAENHVQPEVFSSVPGTLWWGASVLTKLPPVGMQPVTVLGKVIAASTSFSGLALFGVLMGVVSKAMVAGLYGSHENR